MQKKIIHKNILVAPLDWGLGHATRCIPLIRLLQERGFHVIIASSGKQLLLLQDEFPGIATMNLEGYRVRYTKSKRWLPVKILLQAPKILLTIRRENKWLQQVLEKNGIGMVISDNRFGLSTSRIPCVFITHQLLIKAPYGWLERLMQKINYHYLNRFTECWVPDLEGPVNVAGILSHPKHLPAVPVKYTGMLSRFGPAETVQPKYDYFFMLSGPEPQRSILENKVFSIIPRLGARILVLRGLPGEIAIPEGFGEATVINHVPTGTLHRLLSESEYVIGRSGYTTVMEILSMHKKSVLIPTPGQTEQEYLATHLAGQSWCYCCDQDSDLLLHLEKARTFDYQLPWLQENALRTVMTDFFGRFDVPHNRGREQGAAATGPCQ